MSDHVKVEVSPEEPTPAQNPNAAPVPQEVPETPVGAAAPERPEWLPEKFKSPEELATAYQELQSKLGQPKPEEKPEAKPEESTETPATSSEFLAPFTAEYAEKGELGEASYEALAAKGFDRAMVDQYIEGAKAKGAQEDAKIYAAVGGQDAFEQMAEWAAQSLPEDQARTLDDMLREGGDRAVVAANSLKAAYVEANGSPPKLLATTTASIGGDAYQSHHELMKDIGNPEYQTDPDYRRRVQEKLARSKVFQ